MWKARSTSTLFDVKQYCTDIEALYECMWQRHAHGDAPEHIVHLSAYKDNTSVTNAATNRDALSSVADQLTTAAKAMFTTTSSTKLEPGIKHEPEPVPLVTVTSEKV